jgi:hypothetical protein
MQMPVYVVVVVVVAWSGSCRWEEVDVREEKPIGRKMAQAFFSSFE